MLQRTSNQRRPACLIPSTPPLPSQLTTILTELSHNTLAPWSIATGSGVPSICLSACHYLPFYSSSPPFFSLLFLLPSQQDTPLSGRSCQASEGSRWKCDNNTTETKTLGQERRGRMKNAKSTFRLVGILWSPRGPSVVNNRQEVKTQDEGRVCVW